MLVGYLKYYQVAVWDELNYSKLIIVPMSSVVLNYQYYYSRTPHLQNQLLTCFTAYITYG